MKVFNLNEGEEIIGIYGNKDGDNSGFASLGFILWKPINKN